MSDNMARLRRQISTAKDLHSVVRTMKAMSASNIVQYEQSVRALADYYWTVELGLSVCLRQFAETQVVPTNQDPGTRKIYAIVLGSDQGLVGRFNDVVADFAIKSLAVLRGHPVVWTVGERVFSRLADTGLTLKGQFPVPNSVKAIAPLVGQIQLESESEHVTDKSASVYVFHNHPKSGDLYEPVMKQLLPLDTRWQQSLRKVPWRTRNLPSVIGSGEATLRSLIREYLFISLFQACAESLASENANRLAAMQRADKNINEMLDHLQGSFHRLRQGDIDEELFDVIAGFEALVQ